MFTVYGKLLTRTQRVTWVFREVGVAFKQIESRPPAAINPIGKMPALRVEEIGKAPFDLYESFAITQYIAKKLGGACGIGPATPEEEAKISQWSLWVANEVEDAMLILLEGPDDQKDEALAKLRRPLKALDQELEGKEYLVGGRFTVADINVCSIVALWGRAVKLDFSTFPNVAAYVERIASRPFFRQPRKASL